MPIVKILQDFNAAEGWKIGDIVDITSPDKLIVEGKVELYAQKAESISIDTDEPATKSKSRKAKSK
ncbi:MAG: hypothetical protein FJ044_01225 [Candidatus Cloacimonetes bacterium]|nr:hypothetical protein [Candidatus Cloacimonadota bacterium]